jgi:hypothetical protein
MPPRKRAQSASKPEETDEQSVETANKPEAGPDAANEATAEPVAPEESDGDASEAEPEAQDPPVRPADPPERSDIQTGQPCPECFPGGWTAKDDSVGAVGCEHGTWQREPAH